MTPGSLAGEPTPPPASPEANTTTQPLPARPFLRAELMANSSVGDGVPHSHEQETTEAPLNAAVRIPSASWVSVVMPLLDTRTGISFAVQATPATPLPLLPAASASPAQAVPWDSVRQLGICRDAVARHAHWHQFRSPSHTRNTTAIVARSKCKTCASCAVGFRCIGLGVVAAVCGVVAGHKPPGKLRMSDINATDG